MKKDLKLKILNSLMIDKLTSKIFLRFCKIEIQIIFNHSSSTRKSFLKEATNPQKKKEKKQKKEVTSSIKVPGIN